MKRVGVLVADDHPLFREAIVRAVTTRPELELVGELADGRAALDGIRRLRPAVAVLDLRMPDLDGIRITAAVRRDGLPIRVLLLSAFLDPPLVFDAISAGAAGYLSKDADRATILDAIAAIARGQTVLGPEAQTGLAGEVQARASPGRPVLTDRELEVLRHVASGRQAPEIARELVLSPATEGTPAEPLREARGVRPGRRGGRSHAPRPRGVRAHPRAVAPPRAS